MPNQMEAIEMRARWGEKPEELPPLLQNFFDRMFQVEISTLEGEMMDLSPATVTLFRAIQNGIESAQLSIIEKLTADDNVAKFTEGTEGGIAKDMPETMIPFVIAALTNLASISNNAHQEYKLMKSHLPGMLVQLKNSIITQATIIAKAEIEELKSQKTILKNAQPVVDTATANLGHDLQQQNKVKQQTAWFKVRIRKIKDEINKKKQNLAHFIDENLFFETGASLISQPLD